jgi:hypothetical protein
MATWMPAAPATLSAHRLVEHAEHDADARRDPARVERDLEVRQVVAGRDQDRAGPGHARVEQEALAPRVADQDRRALGPHLVHELLAGVDLDRDDAMPQATQDLKAAEAELAHADDDDVVLHRCRHDSGPGLFEPAPIAQQAQELDDRVDDEPDAQDRDRKEQHAQPRIAWKVNRRLREYQAPGVVHALDDGEVRAWPESLKHQRADQEHQREDRELRPDLAGDRPREAPLAPRGVTPRRTARAQVQLAQRRGV